MEWTGISLDKKTKNEIDHMLISDLSIVKDVTTLSQFKFQSNHRFGREKIGIGERIRFKNYRKKDEPICTKIIPYSQKEGNRIKIKGSARN